MNSVSLEGVSHHAAVEILQNAPEDVTLVISQPKEKLSKGNTVDVSELWIRFQFPQKFRTLTYKLDLSFYFLSGNLICVVLIALILCISTSLSFITSKIFCLIPLYRHKNDLLCKISIT